MSPIMFECDDELPQRWLVKMVQWATLWCWDMCPWNIIALMQQ